MLRSGAVIQESVVTKSSLLDFRASLYAATAYKHNEENRMFYIPPLESKTPFLFETYGRSRASKSC